jgi:hypothetical protein
VTRRRDHLDSETLHIEERREGREDLDLAAVTAAAIHAIDEDRALDVF